MSQQHILVMRELLEEFRLLAERFRREKPREVPMLVDSKSVKATVTLWVVCSFFRTRLVHACLVPTFLDLLWINGLQL